MNVKRFRAPTMGEALAQIRKVLGEEAVILRTRKVRKGGLLSFLSRELVEVVAASPDRKPLNPTVDGGARLLKMGLNRLPPEDVVKELQDEIRDLKGHIRELSQRVKYERMPSLPDSLAKIYQDLVLGGMSENTVKDITQAINLKFTGAELEDAQLVDRAVVEAIKGLIKVRRPAETIKGRPVVIAIIGPTGVGKTTTLAKLATSHRFWGRHKTALISADTYRVAAIEQLKTFAAIAGLPLEVVYRPEAMQNALSRHRSRDALFIDTAGRSQTDAARLEELERFLTAAEPDEVLLCLSVSTRLTEQMDIIDRYRRLKPTGLIFTKLDECRGAGGLVEAVQQSGLPVAYLTCGQSVPDDILSPDPALLGEVVLNPNRLTELQQNHFKMWIDAHYKSAREV